MKKRKFDIFKTFEIFNSEAINVIKERIIKFVLVEANNFTDKGSSITADINRDESVQISILNNTRLYNLLSTTWQKQQKVENENIKR